MERFDVIILGAGAAGMMAGIAAGGRGRRVLILDHAGMPGEKIRISGGGRCNFTNLHATSALGRERFLGRNPRFALSALSRYRPEDFVALVKRHKIRFHEKEKGQLFCDGSAHEIIAMLTTELRRLQAEMRLSSPIEAVERGPEGFSVRLGAGTVTAGSLIVATGGKSIPKMGATGLAYKLAAQFGVGVTETRPGLVPLTFEPGALEAIKPLSGVSLEARVSHGRTGFTDALLFTHRGLSGPSILQISSYWREGDGLVIDLLPGIDVMDKLKEARAGTPKLAVQTVIGGLLPRRLAQAIGDELGMPGMIGDFSDKALMRVAARLTGWAVKPVGSEGYRTAEVTLGGVDTDDLDARTMMARAVPGLYFAGEAVDVTGWLGGYNFQWAWASGWAAGQAA